MAAIKTLIKSLPPIRAIQKARYQRRFNRADRSNFFFGVYDSFAAAAAAAPSGKPLGYDNQASAALYDERHSQVYPTDYPVLFWLDKIFPGASRVFEIGGHTGVSFYAYQKYLIYSPKLQWTILEVPAVVEAGRELANQRSEPRLEFTVEPISNDYDVALAAGSLQYLEQPASSVLRGLGEPPKHLLLNLLPVSSEPTYFTVQNMGPAFCPYKIVNRGELIEDLRQLDYELIDEWRNPDKACAIPYSPSRYSVDHYRGYYFRRP